MIMKALFQNFYYDHRLLLILEWHRNSVLLFVHTQIIQSVELITNEKGGGGTWECQVLKQNPQYKQKSQTIYANNVSLFVSYVLCLNYPYAPPNKMSHNLECTMFLTTWLSHYNSSMQYFKITNTYAVEACSLEDIRYHPK